MVSAKHPVLGVDTTDGLFNNIPNQNDLRNLRGQYGNALHQQQGKRPPNAVIHPAADSAQWMKSFFEGANKSSSFHEIGHHMFTILVSLREAGHMDAAFTAELDSIMAEFSVTYEEFITNPEARADAQEKFARHWEAYLATGKAPSKELRGTFAKLKHLISLILTLNLQKLEKAKKFHLWNTGLVLQTKTRLADTQMELLIKIYHPDPKPARTIFKR